MLIVPKKNNLLIHVVRLGGCKRASVKKLKLYQQEQKKNYIPLNGVNYGFYDTIVIIHVYIDIILLCLSVFSTTLLLYMGLE